jgi:SAM-dependent methyltransferase
MKRCTACATGFELDSWRCPRCGGEPRTVNGIQTFALDKACGDGTDADYRWDALASAEADHFWFTSRNAVIGWALDTFFPAARSFFDVGCGTGGVPAYIARRKPAVRVTAADVMLAALETAHGRERRVTWIQADVLNPPFEQEFDVVGAFDVLEHLERDDEALAGMYRIVRPGGGAIITVPQHRSLWSAVDDFSRHKRRYSRNEAIEKTRRAGFEIVHATSFVSLLLPVLLLARRRRRDPRTFDPVAELRLPAPVNAAFGAVSAAERLLVTRRVSLPAGGSLLVVARRPGEADVSDPVQ